MYTKIGQLNGVFQFPTYWGVSESYIAVPDLSKNEVRSAPYVLFIEYEKRGFDLASEAVRKCARSYLKGTEIAGSDTWAEIAGPDTVIF